MKKFSVGDLVSILDEDIEVKIISIEKGVAKVEDEHGFRFQYPIEKLVRKNDFTQIVKRVHQKDGSSEKQKEKSKESRRVIDLHFHEISETDRGYSKHDKLLLQLKHARDQIVLAKKDGISSLILIHGIGKGVLKEQLHKMLKSEINYSFQEADWRTYGQGALEVLIR